MTIEKDKLKAFIHNLWIKSRYSFNEQTAQKELDTLIEELPVIHKITTLEDLLNYITNYFQQDISNICSYSMKGEYVRVKQIYCYMARQLFTRTSLGTIGKTIRIDYDHSTVLHGIRTIENELNNDKFLRKDIKLLFNGLKIVRNTESEKK